ncbi:hypothetical protein ABIB81_002183 [Bradyrhizobium sp. I1.7.5]
MAFSRWTKGPGGLAPPGPDPKNDNVICLGSVWYVSRCYFAVTAFAAFRITSSTTSGFDSMGTWD